MPPHLEMRGLHPYASGRIGPLGEGPALVGGRRVPAGADHRTVLDLFDDIGLIAGIEEFDPRRLGGIQHAPAHRLERQN